MDLSDLSKVGVKLLGAYFLIDGAVMAVFAFGNLIVHVARLGFEPHDVVYVVPSLVITLRPLGHLLAAYLLICRSQWCLRKLGLDSHGT